MATIVWRNAFVAVNGTDYSSDFAQVALNYSSEMLDATTMGADTRIRKGGLKVWSIELTAKQNYASGKTGAAFFALVGTTTCVEVRPDNSCSTAINPSYSGIAILDGAPFGGAVGILLEGKTTLNSAGTLSRASSS